MQVEFDLNKEDYWQYNLYIYYKRKTKFGTFNKILLIVCGFWFFWIGLITGSLFGMLAIIIFGFLLMFILIKTSVYLAVSNSKSTLGNYHISIGPEGVNAKTQHRTILTTWSGIYDVASDRSYIYLFYDNNFAHLIPKRAFATPDDALKFEKLATVYWTTKDLPEDVEV